MPPSCDPPITSAAPREHRAVRYRPTAQGNGGADVRSGRPDCRYAIARRPVQHHRERVLDRILGEVDLPEEPDHGGHRTAELGPEDRPIVSSARTASGLAVVPERADFDRRPD